MRTTKKLRNQIGHPPADFPQHALSNAQNNMEVAVALRLVKHFERKFAIRGAGHNANPGVSSTGPDGSVIDVSALNNIKLSEDKKTVSVRPGATWDQVYSTLEPHELTIVAGRVAGVGVGGLIAGGGMSHFSNAWGMACDHVQNFEVVVPSCEIITASSLTNPDLFRALKGSSSNFGIITNLTLYTNPEYQIWYTFRVYAASDAAAVMTAALAVQHEMTQNDRLGFFLMVIPTYFVAGLLYRGHKTTIPSGFAAFDLLTPITVQVPPTNGTQLSCAQACAMSSKAKRKSGTATVRPDAELYLALQSLLVDMVTKHDVKFAL